tara:strand:- start:732 stop:845 length:114 start_codon:yes stop_codon:yes gene_type:complete
MATPLIAFGYVDIVMLCILKGNFMNLQEKLRIIGKNA